MKIIFLEGERPTLNLRVIRYVTLQRLTFARNRVKKHWNNPLISKKLVELL